MKQGELTAFADEGLFFGEKNKPTENIATMPGLPSCSKTTSKNMNICDSSFTSYRSVS